MPLRGREQIGVMALRRCEGKEAEDAHDEGMVVRMRKKEGTEKNARAGPPTLERRETSLLRTIEEEKEGERSPVVRSPPDDSASVGSAAVESECEEVESKTSASPVSLQSKASELSDPLSGKPEHSCAQFTGELLKLIGRSLNGVASASQVRASSKCPFEGKNVPGISLENYLKRLVRYLEAWKPSSDSQDNVSIGTRAAIMSMVYLDRLCTKANFDITTFNAHRLLLVAFLACIKFTEDTPFPNTFWSRVGGVPLAELNRMEGQFLTLINFDLNVRKEQFDSMLERFSKFM